MKRRSLLLILTIGILAALICAGAIHLWLPYNRGALNMYSYAYWGNPLWGFRDNAAAVERSGGQFVDWSMFGFFTLGIGITIGLVVMRALFWWWPLHPLGYALSASWTMIVFWFPVFVAWGIKHPLMRYGGLKQYKKFRPFFLGMVFGEFGIAVLWTIVSWAADIPAPSFPWP